MKRKSLKTLLKLGSTLLLCLFFMSSAIGQNAITVSGQVTDDKSGEQLVGVNIMVKGTASGTITDMNGSFTLSNVPSNATLVLSSIGYESKEVVVNNQTYIDIVLIENTVGVGEVIVIGYGQTQNKTEVSTAVSTVNSKSIEALPISRAEQALQGTVAGITVTQNSGQPGSAMTVRLRGVSTAGDGQPLYLIDGVQVPDLNHLNSADIANISILKDAAAAAIYGSRGGNGVVLVTTKNGKRNANKPTIQFDGYWGFQNLATTPDLMNRDQYVQYYNEWAALDAGRTAIPDADAARYENTDWFDETFDDNQPIQNYKISIADGGENFSYYLSGSIFDQSGMVGGEAKKSNYNRKNVRLNFDYDVFDNFTIKGNVDVSQAKRNYLFENTASTGTAVMNYLHGLPAIFPRYNDDGTPFDPGQFRDPTIGVNGALVPFVGVGAITNPSVALEYAKNQAITNYSVFNISADWEIVKNLKLNMAYAYYGVNTVQKQFSEAYDQRPSGHELWNDFNDYTEIYTRFNQTQWEGNLQYDFKNLGDDHSLKVMGGFSVVESFSHISSQSGSDFYVNNFDDVNFGLIKDASLITHGLPTEFETGLLSFYGRVNYSFMNKYLVGVTVRSDASSKFGEDNRTGYYPSFSLGWNISEESFLQGIDAISLLKLRASWGINGNDFIPNYAYSSVVTVGTGPSFGGNNTGGISTNTLANKSVQWETITQTDVGVDLNLFNNTLGITLDYYNKKTSDMLINVGVPAYIGKDPSSANVADVENTGFEVMLAYKKQVSNDLSFNAAFNLGYNKNEVTALGELGQPIPGGGIGYIFSDKITLTDLGHPIASFYGYEVEEIDGEGNMIFKDNDGVDGITPDDKTFIGNPFPDFTYGITLGVEFKGFDLSAFAYGQQGNEIYDATVRLDAPFSSRPASYLTNGLRNEIDGVNATDDQRQVSDFYVKDGSFTKLKTLTLGYTLPNSVLESIKLSKVRFYVMAQNLFVITDYDGVDPEIGQAGNNSYLDVGIDRGFYPQPRTIMFGLQANF